MKINRDEIDIILLSDSIRVDQFSCEEKNGSRPLQNFLRNHALDNQNKKLSVTWIIVKKSDPSVPLGYFSLACASIDIDDLDTDYWDGRPEYDRFPALLIGKFAVDDHHQGIGIGTLLMDYVYAITIRLSEIIGCRYLIVESKPTSTWFYEKQCNFIRIRELDGGNVLFYKNVVTLTGE